MRKNIANIAIKTAKESEFPRYRHGAVLECGGKVLTKSPNLNKAHGSDISRPGHAEVTALKRLITKGRLKRGVCVNIYVARISPAEKVVLSKPCPICLEALRKSGMVRSIFYSMNDGSWQEVRL
jgi:tRNA(Arg) A34 adenosine deaminase TadA